MALVTAKPRLSSLSSRRLLINLCFSSSTSSQSHFLEDEPSNDAVNSNTTSPTVISREETVIADTFHALIDQHHRENPDQDPLPASPNFIIPTLSLGFSQITSLPLSVATVRRVIDRCGRGRKGVAFVEVLSFFNWVIARGDCAQAPEVYNDMIDLAGKFWLFHLAWDLVDLMKARDVKIMNLTFLILVKRYLKAGLISEALNVFDQMPGYGCVPDEGDYKGVISYLCKKKRVVEAKWFLDRVKDRFELDVSVYNDLVSGWCRSGKIPEAERVIGEMKMAGIQPNVDTYSIIIDTLCRREQVVRAREVLAEMVDTGCIPAAVTFNSLMLVHLKTKQNEKVFELYDQMKMLGCSPGTITCNFVIEAHCKAKNLEKAIKVLDFMVTNGCTPNITTFNLLFGCIAKLRIVKRANLLYEKMKELKCKPNIITYNTLMQMFGDAKSTEMVLRLKKEMEKSEIFPNVETYQILIPVFCRKGQWENAYKFFKEMISEKGLRPSKKTYEMVLEQLRKAGQLEKHTKLMREIVARGIAFRPSK